MSPVSENHARDADPPLYRESYLMHASSALLIQHPTRNAKCFFFIHQDSRNMSESFLSKFVLSLHSPVRIILYYKWTTRRLANSAETAESSYEKWDKRCARRNWIFHRLYVEKPRQRETKNCSLYINFYVVWS